MAVVRKDLNARPSVVTFKKMARKGRKAIYKLQKESTSKSDTPPPSEAPPRHKPEEYLPDVSFMGVAEEVPVDSDVVMGGDDDADVRLPRRATVRTSYFAVYPCQLVLNHGTDSP